jgi:hypothetical protein
MANVLIESFFPANAYGRKETEKCPYLSLAA